MIGSVAYVREQKSEVSLLTDSSGNVAAPLDTFPYLLISDLQGLECRKWGPYSTPRYKSAAIMRMLSDVNDEADQSLHLSDAAAKSACTPARAAAAASSRAGAPSWLSIWAPSCSARAVAFVNRDQSFIALSDIKHVLATHPLTCTRPRRVLPDVR